MDCETKNKINDDFEINRNFMIDKYHSKIQDHVFLLFAVIGAWYTVFNTSPARFLSNQIILSIIVSSLVWITAYIFGRLVFWSQYNSFLLIIKPLDREEIKSQNDKPLAPGYLENIKWNFHDAVIRRIQGRKPYDDIQKYPRYLNTKMADAMSGQWLFNYGIHLIALFVFYLNYFWIDIVNLITPHVKLLTIIALLTPSFSIVTIYLLTRMKILVN